MTSDYDIYSVYWSYNIVKNSFFCPADIYVGSRGLKAFVVLLFHELTTRVPIRTVNASLK